jgi:hypothetical protein
MLDWLTNVLAKLTRRDPSDAQPQVGWKGGPHDSAAGGQPGASAPAPATEYSTLPLSGPPRAEPSTLVRPGPPPCIASPPGAETGQAAPPPPAAS